PRSPNASQPTFYPRADLSRMRRRRRGFAARLAGGKAGGPMRIVEGRVRVAASDVANFLACQELTQLDLRAARRTLRPPHPRDLGFEDLVRRGEEHEMGMLEGFRADGGEVADLSGAGDPAGGTAGARGRAVGTTRWSTPSWPGRRRPGPFCRPRSTRGCWPNCKGPSRAGCTW